MVIIKKTRNNFASFTGTPVSNTDWEKCDFGQNFYHMKIIVAIASLEFSLDGVTVHGTLPIGTYTFSDINLSKIFIRKLASVVQVYGYGVD